MDAIITVGADQRITLFNAAAERMFGYSATMVLGHPLDMLLPEPFRALHRVHVRTFGETGVTMRTMRHQMALWGLRADGSQFPIEAAISQVEVEGQKLFTVILRDITERIQAEAERERLLEAERLARESAEAARAAAEEAVHARDEFLSIASHELRNPLAGIKSTLQALRRAQERGVLEPERLERYLETLERTSVRLAALTDDLLDVARLQVGQLAIRPRNLDLVALVRQTVLQYRTRASLPIAVETPDACNVVADPDRVEQIVDNLLDNAIKYSPDGGQIAVRLAPWTGKDGTPGALLEVRDTGIGLPAGSAESLFRPFGRARNAQDRNIPGLGLGLYVSRQIAERHGGWLGAESAGEGKGTAMRLWLPGRVRGLPPAARREDDIGA